MPQSIRVLILTNDAGSGHRSAARALDAAFQQVYGSAADVTVYNPLSHASAPPLLRRYEQVYLDGIQHTPALYHLSYAISDLPGFTQILHHSVQQMLQATFREILTASPVDLVISVYPIYTSIVAASLRRAVTRPALMSVVTDLGAVHSTWFNRVDDLCAVPTPIAWRKAIRCGMERGRVITTGIPVHPEFGAPRADIASLRHKLGWRTDLPVLLLLGGGAGVGKLDVLAQAIDSARLPLQIAVVAGTNQALAEQLRSYSWNIPAHVYEFVPLADLMHAADIVATKAGGLTISEALAAGKPLLIHGDPPGQEEGNLRYIQSHGAGHWTPNADDLVQQVARWLNRPAEMRAVMHQAQQLGVPDAAINIVRHGWDLVAAGPYVNPPVKRRLRSRNSVAWM